jgi:hypothetical protein
MFQYLLDMGSFWRRDKFLSRADSETLASFHVPFYAMKTRLPQNQDNILQEIAAGLVLSTRRHEAPEQTLPGSRAKRGAGESRQSSLEPELLKKGLAPADQHRWSRPCRQIIAKQNFVLNLRPTAPQNGFTPKEVSKEASRERRH